MLDSWEQRTERRFSEAKGGVAEERTDADRRETRAPVHRTPHTPELLKE